MIHDNALQNDTGLLCIGSRDWEHAAWLGGFYPDDLPEDWRLGYYANEFSCVLVPEVKWQGVDLNKLEWVDDVPEHFRFYFQLTEPLSESVEQSLIQAFGQHFGGTVLVEPGQVEDDQKIVEAVACLNLHDRTLRGWREWLQQNAESCRVIFAVEKVPDINMLRDFKSLLELMGL